MPPANLLCDSWSKGRAHAEEDASLLADLIYGHLMHHFSNQEVFLSWTEDSALRIRSMLTAIARFHQRVPPSYALRALLVVLSMKDEPGMKNSTAASYNAEILWMVAFWKLAGRLYPCFNMGTYLYYTHPWPSGNKDYRDKTFSQVPRMLDPYLLEALSFRRRLSDAGKADEIMRFWLAPWMVGSETPGLAGILAESPAMRTHSLYTPQLLSGPEHPLAAASLTFRPDFHRKQRLSPILDEEEPSSGDEDHVDFDSEGDSFATKSSFIDSLADESFATTSTSLTSVGTAAGPAAATTTETSTAESSDDAIPEKPKAPPMPPRHTYWTDEGYWVEGVNFVYHRPRNIIVEYGPPLRIKRVYDWDRPPIQSPELIALIARRVNRRNFYRRLIRPWTWLGTRVKEPPERLEGS